MRQIVLTLSVDDTNLVLEALGAMPYARVYQLIGEIHRQAAESGESAGPKAVEDTAGRSA